MKQIIFIIIGLATAAFSKNYVETSKTQALNIYKGDRYVLDSLIIQSQYYPRSYFVFDDGTPEGIIIELSRNFQNEVLEFVDRESVEIKNDEN